MTGIIGMVSPQKSLLAQSSASATRLGAKQASHVNNHHTGQL